MRVRGSVPAGLVGLITVVMTTLGLTACGAREVPAAVVSDAAGKMSAMKSLKFDLSGETKTHTNLGAGSGAAARPNPFLPSELDTKFDGTGAAALPAQTSIDLHQTMGETSTRVRAITIGDVAYFTNPTTGGWFKLSAKGLGAAGALTTPGGQFDPTSTSHYLKNAQSVTDLGDTVVDGSRVHHYQLTLDPEKLKEALQANAPSALAGQAGLGSGFTIKSYRVETWIGVEDHLVRQMWTDYAMAKTPSAALPRPGNCVPPVFGQAPKPGTTACPPDLSTYNFDTSGSIKMKFHDFNSHVTIAAPQNAQDIGDIGSQLAKVFGSLGGTTSPTTNPPPSR